MKPAFPLLFAAVLGAAVIPLNAKIERTVERSFNVTGMGTIHLETSGGSIRVVPGTDGVVKVTAHQRIRANSDAEADRLLQDLQLTFDQSGNDVRASAKYAASKWRMRFGPTPVQVDFTAVVPAQFAADVHTSGGGLTIGNLDGEVRARTSGGSIKLGRLGGKVDARTSGGSIQLAESRDEVTLDTSGGTISVGRVAGPAKLSTSGGSISIDSVEQSLWAHTSGGSIRAAIKGPLQGDCSLSTSGGSIRMTVDESAAFQLDASTHGGGVTAEGIAVTTKGGKPSRNKLAGSVNGGGPELKLRTSGGHITVRAD